MLLVSYIQQYFNTSITVLTNRVWKLLIALFKVPNTGAFTVLTSPEWVTHADLSWSDDVVHVLQEGFVLDLVVGEDERDSLSLLTGDPVQVLEVFHQVAHIVRSADRMKGNVNFVIRGPRGGKMSRAPPPPPPRHIGYCLFYFFCFLCVNDCASPHPLA